MSQISQGFKNSQIGLQVNEMTYCYPLTNVTDFSGKYRKLYSCKNKTKTILFTRKDCFLKSSNMKLGNYFDKIQNLCFLGQLKSKSESSFPKVINSRPIVQEKFVLLVE